MVTPLGLSTSSSWTRLLAGGSGVSALPEGEGPQTVLDFACGGGVICADLRSRWPDAVLTGLDADALALEVARRNDCYDALVVSDGWRRMPAQRFEMIISNPPIHRGRMEDHRVLGELLAQSSVYLAPQGTLWLVGQKRLRLRDHLNTYFGRVHCQADDGRFQVWSASS